MPSRRTQATRSPRSPTAARLSQCRRQRLTISTNILTTTAISSNKAITSRGRALLYQKPGFPPTLTEVSPMAKTREQYDAVTLISEKPQIMVFQNLVEPKAPPLKHGKAKPQYSATFLLDPTDPVFSGEGKSIVRLSLAVAKEEFPTVYADAVKAAKANGGASLAGVLKHLAANVKLPFEYGDAVNEARAADGKSAYAWAPGKVLFKASSGVEYPPKLGSTASGKGILFDKD